jgi:hypothetical protein
MKTRKYFGHGGAAVIVDLLAQLDRLSEQLLVERLVHNKCKTAAQPDTEF